MAGYQQRNSQDSAFVGSHSAAGAATASIPAEGVGESASTSLSSTTTKANIAFDSRRDCPDDSDSLGRAGWYVILLWIVGLWVYKFSVLSQMSLLYPSVLHTMAAYYPEAPTATVRTDMTNFIRLFSHFYPCGHCADHLRDHIARNPPDTTSQHGLSQWMCTTHNEVNKRQGKPLFDCSLVGQRWKDGWTDGSCD